MVLGEMWSVCGALMVVLVMSASADDSMQNVSNELSCLLHQHERASISVKPRRDSKCTSYIDVSAGSAFPRFTITASTEICHGNISVQVFESNDSTTPALYSTRLCKDGDFQKVQFYYQRSSKFLVKVEMSRLNAVTTPMPVISFTVQGVKHLHITSDFLWLPRLGQSEGRLQFTGQSGVKSIELIVPGEYRAQLNLTDVRGDTRIWVDGSDTTELRLTTYTVKAMRTITIQWTPPKSLISTNYNLNFSLSIDELMVTSSTSVPTSEMADTTREETSFGPTSTSTLQSFRAGAGADSADADSTDTGFTDAAIAKNRVIIVVVVSIVGAGVVAAAVTAVVCRRKSHFRRDEPRSSVGWQNRKDLGDDQDGRNDNDYVDFDVDGQKPSASCNQTHQVPVENPTYQNLSVSAERDDGDDQCYTLAGSMEDENGDADYHVLENPDQDNIYQLADDVTN